MEGIYFQLRTNPSNQLLFEHSKCNEQFKCYSTGVVSPQTKQSPPLIVTYPWEGEGQRVGFLVAWELPSAWPWRCIGIFRDVSPFPIHKSPRPVVIPVKSAAVPVQWRGLLVQQLWMFCDSSPEVLAPQCGEGGLNSALCCLVVCLKPGLGQKKSIAKQKPKHLVPESHIDRSHVKNNIHQASIWSDKTLVSPTKAGWTVKTNARNNLF